MLALIPLAEPSTARLRGIAALFLAITASLMGVRTLRADQATAVAVRWRTTVRIDHATGDRWLVRQSLTLDEAAKGFKGLWSCSQNITGPCWRDAESPQPLLKSVEQKRVPIGYPVVVEVIRTNTAVYTMSLAGSPVEAQEIADLQAFGKLLGPNLVDLGKSTFTFDRNLSTSFYDIRGKAVTAPRKCDLANAVLKDALDAGTAVADALESLWQRTYGPTGIRQTHLRVVDALRIMSTSQGQIWTERARLRSDIADRFDGVSPALVLQRVPDASPPFMTSIENASKTLQQLPASLAQLHKAKTALVEELKSQRCPDLKDKSSESIGILEKIAAAAEKALDESPKFFEVAYAVQAVAVAAMNAQDAWVSDEIRVTWSTGQKISVSVKPKPAPEMLRTALIEDKQFVLTVVPDWLVRPALGVSLMYAHSAVFTKFGTQKTTAGTFKITESPSDQRFAYGVDLGLTWRFMDWREESGVAVWLPELIVNPTSDVKVLGLGAGITVLKILKFGGGFLWIKHDVLKSDRTQELLTADSLSTGQVYGRRKWFVSLSVFGWAPFK